MVKINKTLGLALLTALAASCSSDNDVAQSNNPVIENGKGAYTKISINLPTTDQASPFSRAGEPTYDDGDATEYSVKNGVVLVFQDVDGNDQNAVFTGSSALDLTHSSWSTPGVNKNVTKEASFVVNLPSYDAKTGNLILVLLNNKKSDGKTDKVTLPAVGQKYGDWNKAQATEAVGTDMQDHSNSNGFFMASAAGYYPVSTLTFIDPANVTYDVNKASSLTSTDVYVERGLAKVTMAQPEEKTVQAGRAYAGDKVSFNAWSLDVTNKKSYPVHTVEGMTYDFSKQTRFFSTPADDNDFQRVYWGVDPNYSLGADYITGTDAKTKLADEFTMLAPDAKIDGAFGTPQYCLENTFDIDNMTQGQTTRVVIKATYTPKDGTANTTFYKLGNTSKLYTKEELEAHIKDIIKKDGYPFLNHTLKLDAKDNDITKAGTHTLSPANFESTVPGSGAKTRGGAEVQADWDVDNGPDNINNIIGSISTYENGVCYYIGRIKHFGDVLTPWNPGDPTYGGSANNDKYLGRYGVLRNNWYDLTLGTVTGPGDPTVPPVVPEKPDDEKNNYINLSVKILSWAMRKQTIDL